MRLDRLLSKFKPAAPVRVERAPDGKRLYAVGDVHGRDDLLGDLLAKIEADAGQERCVLIFLGDYVDRGRQSRDVIERLISLSASRHEVVFLRGNHEAAMLTFLEQPDTGPYWLKIGGDETLRSYGVEPPAREADLSEFQSVAAEFRAKLPAAHLEFLRALTLSARYGDYVFVHAGLRPGRALEQQDAEDLLEIRKPFLNSTERWPFVVVHGHSPVDQGYRDERRIAVDTGAYATGRLTAVRLEGETVFFLATA